MTLPRLSTTQNNVSENNAVDNDEVGKLKCTEWQRFVDVDWMFSKAQRVLPQEEYDEYVKACQVHQHKLESSIVEIFKCAHKHVSIMNEDDMASFLQVAQSTFNIFKSLAISKIMRLCDGVGDVSLKFRFTKAQKVVLQQWKENHEEDPFPNEVEKELLVKRTGLHLKQVEDWFVNQRVRQVKKQWKR